MELAVDTADSEAGTVLTVRGELDIATVGLLREALDKALVGAPPVLYLDLTPLDFIDSTGCRELVRSSKAATGGGTTLELVCPEGNKRVRRIVDFMQLDALLPVHEQLPST